MSVGRRWVFALGCCVVVTRGQSPVVVLDVNGIASPEALGSQNAVAGIGDVDGDGVPDFAAGAPGWPMPHPTIPGATIAGVGRAAVFSGATGAQIFSVAGTFNLQAFGKAVADVGDLDGDGVHDVAFGAPMFGPVAPGGTPPPQQVQVWSGFAHTMIYMINGGAGGFSSTSFGAAIAGVGDVGKVVGGMPSYVPDGYPDILVGAPDGNAVHLHSGADGALMYTVNAAALNLPGQPVILTGADKFGESVAGVGDVTGDGVPDLLVGARVNALGGAAGGFNAGAALLLSGAGGGVHALVLGAPGDVLGQSVAGLGDVSGDGVPDFAIGAVRTDVGGTDTGSVTAYSGSGLATLWTTHGLVAADQFGYALAAGGDVDGDGRTDLVVGTPTTDVGATNTGSVVVLSGATGLRLGQVNGLVASDLRGRSVGGLGDVDGDGFAEVLVGTPSSDVGGNATGSVQVVSYGLFLGDCARGNLPDGMGGTFDLIRINGTAGGPPRRVDLGLGVPFTVSFLQPPALAAPAYYYAFALVGFPNPLDAADPGFGVGTLCFLPPILAPFDTRLVLAANSLVPYDPTALFPAATPAPYAITLPAGLAFPLRVAAQGVVFDPTGILRTNAILLDVK